MVTTMARGALYYPYIHIDDLDWLKGTLLLFKSVSRMLPPEYTQGSRDDPRLMGFQDLGLLKCADLSTERSIAAQRVLAEKILADSTDPAFMRRYGRAEATRLRSDPYGFQIHSYKSASPLRGVLLETGLAWEPDDPEYYDRDHRYIEMHPRVGQVVMATIAVACAQHEGLDIVGDARSGELHQVLLEKDLDSIYDAWLGNSMPEPPSPASEEDVFEFLIATTADVSQLTPDSLNALDREPLNALLDAIKREAKEIPAMDPGSQRDKHFEDAASQILSDWRADRQNLSPSWRTFFGAGRSEAASFFKKAADGAMTGAGGVVVADATYQAALGKFEQGMFAAGAGLIIGLATKGIRSHRTLREQAARSPYRYLTVLEQSGVTFRGAETANVAL
jgi:hypothetical protein